MVLEKILKAIKNKSIRVNILMKSGLLDFIPDDLYLKCIYKKLCGKSLNIIQPKLFSEKLQWLKLYDQNPKYTIMSDKYEAKKYVKDIIGEKYIINNLGIWDKFDDINFEKLPNQFVIKCTHDSGSVIVCKDKTIFNINEAKKKISKSLKKNMFYYGREWNYKNIKPRILIEKYIENEDLGYLLDYKFYCFSGEPKFLYISNSNIINGKKNDEITHLNIDFSIAEFQRKEHKTYDAIIKKPNCFNEMVELAKKLSYGIPFVRVDLYCVDNKIYFSEFTFYPGSGFFEYSPYKYNKIIGDWLIIPSKNEH